MGGNSTANYYCSPIWKWLVLAFRTGTLVALTWMSSALINSGVVSLWGLCHIKKLFRNSYHVCIYNTLRGFMLEIAWYNVSFVFSFGMIDIEIQWLCTYSHFSLRSMWTDFLYESKNFKINMHIMLLSPLQSCQF